MTDQHPGKAARQLHDSCVRRTHLLHTLSTQVSASIGKEAHAFGDDSVASNCGGFGGAGNPSLGPSLKEHLASCPSMIVLFVAVKVLFVRDSMHWGHIINSGSGVFFVSVSLGGGEKTKFTAKPLTLR